MFGVLVWPAMAVSGEFPPLPILLQVCEHLGPLRGAGRETRAALDFLLQPPHRAAGPAVGAAFVPLVLLLDAKLVRAT